MTPPQGLDPVKGMLSLPDQQGHMLPMRALQLHRCSLVDILRLRGVRRRIWHVQTIQNLECVCTEPVMGLLLGQDGLTNGQGRPLDKAGVHLELTPVVSAH